MCYIGSQTVAENSSLACVALIVVGSIVALLGISYLLLFFVFNKWIKLGDKAIRVARFGMKSNKVRVLTMSFKPVHLEEHEVFNSKEDALK